MPNEVDDSHFWWHVLNMGWIAIESLVQIHFMMTCNHFGESLNLVTMIHVQTWIIKC